MLCSSIEKCHEEIAAYFDSEVSGYPLLVNIDDYKLYQLEISKIKADSSKSIIRLSDYGNGDSFPNHEKAIREITDKDNCVFIGISQYIMFRGSDELNQMVAKLLQLSVKGHVVILLNLCGSILRKHISNDLRYDHRVILMDGITELPKIYLAKPEVNYIDGDYCDGINKLFEKLENYIPTADRNSITVKTRFSSSVFSKSMYVVTTTGGIYESMVSKYHELESAIEKAWGTDAQWEDLYKKMNSFKSLSAIIDDVVGSTINIQSYIDEQFADTNQIYSWYLWLGMKVFGTKGNRYLSEAVKKSSSPVDLIYHIYMDLLYYDYNDAKFFEYYDARKRLVYDIGIDEAIMGEYCDHVGKHDKNMVYYLSDITDREKLLFLRCINKYQYSDDEINTILKHCYPEISAYMTPYEFTRMNTQIPAADPDIYGELTFYFNKYKYQKLSNKISDDFMALVNQYAISRPYNKLLPRTAIMNSIDKKDAQLHFFDALGVEYLSYITSKCEKYGLQADVHVGHCELPSITKNNIEFKKYFKLDVDSDGNEKIPGTKDLDELKHHSKLVDYTKCKEPIHLFMELEIIDRELKNIKSMIVNGEYSKFIIVADHGASRLAVIHQSESSLFQLENQGEHSGRCCETPESPNIPEAAYENGYAVLANYDRFKGSRAANVEVHGGASLEETLVPIIEITKKPENAEYYFTDNVVEFRNKEIVSVVLYSNMKISSPKLVITSPSILKDTVSLGNQTVDGHNYKFDFPEIRRTTECICDLYDGNKPLIKNISFVAKRTSASTKDFF